MPFLDTNHQRAALLILLLGAGLSIALAPYLSGLIGGLVLYVVFAPLHRWIAARVSAAFGASVVVVLALLLFVLPGLGLASILVDQAQDMAGRVVQSRIIERLQTIRVGETSVGQQLAGAGQQIVSWLGSNAIRLLGTATRVALNLTISLFIAYYLLLRPGEAWTQVRPYIPFSEANAERLRDRFYNVTISTLIGTGLNACIQGGLVALGFWLTGLPNALFWAVVTAVFSILPVVGSGLVWGPGALSLVLDGRYGAALGLVVGGVAVVGNVDLVIRPFIFRRYAKIHPLVTLIGAFGGVAYFGLLGLLIGPLALSYFFELIGMYREEYLNPEFRVAGSASGTPASRS
jgi:predicted PurR-regulated permease PerM